MKDLILVGIQGSGKGTLATVLAKKYGYVVFEMGDILRKMAETNIEIKELLAVGGFPSNEIIMSIVDDFLKSTTHDSPVIFDGMPRHEKQRVLLEKILKRQRRKFQVLEISISEQVAISRLIIRAKCNDCGHAFGSQRDLCPQCRGTNIYRREDDTEEGIKERLKKFHLLTEPMLEKWKSHDCVITVNGNQHPADVAIDVELSLTKKV